MRFRSVRWPADGPSLQALFNAAEHADGRPPLSEHKLLRSMPLVDGEVGLVALVDGGVAGYGHASPHPGGWGVEVVLCPDLRSPAGYAALLAETIRELPTRDRFGAWAVEPDTVKAAQLLGLVEVRALHQLRRRLPAPRSDVPAPYVVRPFRVGIDEGDWLEVHDAAFEHHPEHAGMDPADLALRMRQPWFDPSGFLVAWDGPTMAGFCWMKMHSGSLGEIYIIGVGPDHRGKGLGTALALAGLDYAATRGAGEGMLYVEGDNAPGLALYESLGFRVHLVNHLYAPTDETHGLNAKST